VARTLYPAQVAQNYSEAKWSLADDNAQNQTKPVAGDTIICTVNSGKVTCDETWAAVSLSATGACEWDFASETGELSGAVTLDDITTTAAAASITAAAFDIGTDGKLTLSDDMAIISPQPATGFELDGGEIDTNGNTIALTGDLVKSSGTDTECNVHHIGDANLSFSGLDAYQITSGTITATGDSAGASLVVDSSCTLALGSRSFVIAPPANDFIDIQGEVTRSTGEIVVQVAASRSNAGRLVVPKFDLWMSDDMFTQTGETDIGLLLIRGWVAGQFAQYVVGSAGQSLGEVTLGVAVDDKHGKLDTGDYPVSIASLTDAAAGSSEAALGASSIELSGTFDGSDIVVTSIGANVHGGTIQDVTSAGVIHCWGVTDGTGNNQYVAHQSGVQPRGLLMGVLGSL